MDAVFSLCFDQSLSLTGVTHNEPVAFAPPTLCADHLLLTDVKG